MFILNIERRIKRKKISVIHGMLENDDLFYQIVKNNCPDSKRGKPTC